LTKLVTQLFGQELQAKLKFGCGFDCLVHRANWLGLGVQAK
jgi:hypothetical protein